MKKLDYILGGIGVFLTAVSLIWYSITRVWEVYHWILIVLGIGALGYFFYMYFTKREKVMSSRSLKQGSNALLQIIIMLVIVGLIICCLKIMIFFECGMALIFHGVLNKTT